MKDTRLVCQDEQRRHQVRTAELNGLDYLEVSDDQRRLTVYFLGKAPEGLATENVRIEGGRRIRDIRVIDVEIQRQDDPELDDCMTVTVNKPGDFSTYTLCLVVADERGRPTDEPFAGFDPRYACTDFSFKAGCPSDLDCKPQEVCPPEERDEPEIDYLAKDYASFRQLILDRLALVMPEWQERHVPDIGIALVEVLAYAGDYLSYYQDAVATEAYLDTARQRISVRRHARLVDYHMHEGNNARAWVHVWTSQDLSLDATYVYFITGANDALRVSGRILTPEDLRSIPASQYEVFEPLVDNPQTPIQLREAHNEIPFYTWGDQECCLLRGTTTATLADGWVVVEEPEPEETGPYQQTVQYDKPPDDEPEPERERKLDLHAGDVLIFEEIVGPETNNPADADPRHRHAVRLTRVEQAVDPLYDQPIVEIEWAEADALPFPLCISTIGPAPECELLENVSVARGNVILVDHGRHIDDEDLGRVPVDTTELACGDACDPAEVQVVSGTYRPRLAEGRLVFSQPLSQHAPAATLLTQNPRQALPWIGLVSIPALPDGSGTVFAQADLEDPANLATRLLERADSPVQFLRSQLSSETRELLDAEPDPQAPSDALLRSLAEDLERLIGRWTPQRDLLASRPPEHHFVAEMDNAGRAQLRFGDGELGRVSPAGSQFLATYRVGGGPAGNVGAETITHIVLRRTRLSGVTLKPRNPLPAVGGTAPEPLAEVKTSAPHAFRMELQRAITADDYARLAERHPKVQRAAAALRWTGSWYEVLVAIDPLGQVEADARLLSEIKGHLYPFRRIGHDLVVAPARQVPLDVELTVCVLPDFLRGHVKAELLDVLSNRRLSDGRRGFFHPDNLTFGEGIFMSRLLATAQAVRGVESVTVTKFERLFEGPNHEIERGVLPLGPLEVARLDNDPSFPENGTLKLNMAGGR